MGVHWELTTVSLRSDFHKESGIFVCRHCLTPITWYVDMKKILTFVSREKISSSFRCLQKTCIRSGTDIYARLNLSMWWQIIQIQFLTFHRFNILLTDIWNLSSEKMYSTLLWYILSLNFILSEYDCWVLTIWPLSQISKSDSKSSTFYKVSSRSFQLTPIWSEDELSQGRYSLSQVWMTFVFALKN